MFYSAYSRKGADENWVVAGLAWSIVYSYSPVEALWVAFLMVFRDFLFVGVLVASLIWLDSFTLEFDVKS
jgi:hypothetical protein